MELGVYFRLNGAGPVVLVPSCMLPSRTAENLHGPLAFWRNVETDDPVLGIEWESLLAQILDDTFTTMDRQVFGLVVGSPPPPQAATKSPELHA